MEWVDLNFIYDDEFEGLVTIETFFYPPLKVYADGEREDRLVFLPIHEDEKLVDAIEPVTFEHTVGDVEDETTCVTLYGQGNFEMKISLPYYTYLSLMKWMFGRPKVYEPITPYLLQCIPYYDLVVKGEGGLEFVSPAGEGHTSYRLPTRMKNTITFHPYFVEEKIDGGSILYHFLSLYFHVWVKSEMVVDFSRVPRKLSPHLSAYLTNLQNSFIEMWFPFTALNKMTKLKRWLNDLSRGIVGNGKSDTYIYVVERFYPSFTYLFFAPIFLSGLVEGGRKFFSKVVFPYLSERTKKQRGRLIPVNLTSEEKEKLKSNVLVGLSLGGLVEQKKDPLFPHIFSALSEDTRKVREVFISF